MLMVLIDAAKKTKMTVVKDWLVPGDVSPVHLSALEQHYPETGQWFLDGPWFSQWQMEGSQHLWIAGDGKCRAVPAKTARTLTRGSGVWKDSIMV
jgi:hypothetical protein